jgi:Kef-type K+ transport system membrane component KefB
MGAILLMWGAGVELEVGMLREGRRLLSAAAVGLGGAACSAGLTWVLLEQGLLGTFPLTERYGIALLSAASAIPVLIAVAQSVGQLHHPRTRTALAAALFVDLAIIAMIPAVSAEQAAEPPLMHLAKTVGYLALMIVLAEGPWRDALRSAGRAIWGSSPRKPVVIALGFGVTLGWVALMQQLGLDLVPAALGWGIGSKPLLFPRAEDGVTPFFDALFPFETSYFALAGAMLDPRLLTWGGVLFGLAAIACKIAGGSVRGVEGLRLGVLLVPRGAVDLVLAVTLLVNGTLSMSGYALAVTLIAITTVGGALLARLAFLGAPERECQAERLGFQPGASG